MPSHSQLIIEGQKVSPVRDSQSRKEPGASSIAKFETALSNLKVDFFTQTLSEFITCTRSTTEEGTNGALIKSRITA